MAETSYKVPVYRGWPEKPYDVIGSVRFVDPRGNWDEGIVRAAASRAKKMGGDGLVLRRGSEMGIGMVTGFGNDPSTMANSEATGLVIKWKADAVVRADNLKRQDQIDEVKNLHPELAADENLIRGCTEYIRRAGLPNEKLVPILQQLKDFKPGNFSGKWLLRGNVRNDSLTDSISESFYAIASVEQTEDSLAILASEKGIELNFGGTIQKGRIEGQFGIKSGFSTMSAKAEGVAVKERISLTSQRQTPGGTFQGNFTLER